MTLYNIISLIFIQYLSILWLSIDDVGYTIIYRLNKIINLHDLGLAISPLNIATM